MDLKKLTNQELEESLNKAIAAERRMTVIVILHLLEINRRGLYNLNSFGSLYEYLIKNFHYSSTSAQRRVEAVRLIEDVPGAERKLLTGEMNLSQMCEVQKSVKQAEKVHQEKIGKAIKADLVRKILAEGRKPSVQKPGSFGSEGLSSGSLKGESLTTEGQESKGSESSNSPELPFAPITVAKTQQLCAEALNIPVVQHQKVRTQKDESRRVEFTMTKEQCAKFEKLRDRLAHKHLQKKRTQDFGDVLETIFDEVLKSFSPEEKPLQHLESQSKANSKSSNRTDLKDSNQILSSGKSAGPKSSTKKFVKATNYGTASATDSVVEVSVGGNVSEANGQSDIGQKANQKVNSKQASSELQEKRSVELRCPDQDQTAKNEINKNPNTNTNREVCSNQKTQVRPTSWKSLTPKRKRIILAEDKCCQYENPETGRICGSTFNLQIDHIIPRKLGGSHSPSNLRVLCRQHNLFRERC